MSGALAGVGRAVYRLGFEISPIILTNGIAGEIPGQMLPIVAITEAANFVTGLLSGSDVVSLDNFFAHFRPLPGGTLISNQLGRYPFANQTVAANAIISQPLNVSLRMDVPVNKPGGHAAKLATFMALQAVLEAHSGMGGTYTIATPAFIYTNCILLMLRDVSGGESTIPQHAWQFDFEKPLITLADAAAAQNTLMTKLTNGTPTDGSLSGPPVAPTSPLTGAATGTPGATNLAGVSAGGYTAATGGAPT